MSLIGAPGIGPGQRARPVTSAIDDILRRRQTGYQPTAPRQSSVSSHMGYRLTRWGSSLESLFLILSHFFILFIPIANNVKFFRSPSTVPDAPSGQSFSALTHLCSTSGRSAASGCPVCRRSILRPSHTPSGSG